MDPKFSDPKIEIFETALGPFSSDRGKTKPRLVI